MARLADTSRRISVRLPSSIDQLLKRRSKLTGKSESVLVREAIETLVTEPAKKSDATRTPLSAYDLASRLGLVSSAKDLPTDLSTNPEHMEGFGVNK